MSHHDLNRNYMINILFHEFSELQKVYLVLMKFCTEDML